MEGTLPPSRSATDELVASGVIAIIRSNDPLRILALAKAIIDGGIRAIEISLTSPGALDAIARLSSQVSAGTIVGAGTVLSTAHAEGAIKAGSQFLFSPSFDAGVLRTAQAHGIPFIPAALTPTEVLSLFGHGLRLIKIFPAGPLGAGYLRDLLGPLPELRAIPTGGITRENARAFLDAGAVAVGIGGALTAGVSGSDYEPVTRRSAEFCALAAEAKISRHDT
jgi:2-dehydro-3-deoxyphosphogluconate aldolase / (4S)-4-hydroxy-2-oxoglutarate aldolase